MQNSTSSEIFYVLQLFQMEPILRKVRHIAHTNNHYKTVYKLAVVTVPIPATGINNSTRVAQDLAEQNFVVSYFQSMSLLSEFYLDIAKPDLSDITQSDRVELYNLGKNFQQHRTPYFCEE